MKICWDNLENLKLTRNGYFRDIVKRTIFRYVDECKTCKEPFLTRTNTKGIYCCNCCKRLTEESKRKVGDSHKGKRLSEEHKKKISDGNKGRKSSKSTREKIRKSKIGENNPMYGRYGRKSGNWKGGYTSKNIPTYDTYATQLKWTEEVRRNEKDPNILEVKCFKCTEWFIPKAYDVYNRIQYLKGNDLYYENRFYCSNGCKHTCSVFRKSYNTIMKEDSIRAGRLTWLELKREIQPELRQMVLDRDEYQCVKCSSDENLQCHHIMPVVVEPLLSADVDNCITLCKDCHKEAHKQDGCRYGQLRIEEC
jgi:hypothetical protein